MSTFKYLAVLAMAAASMTDASRLPHGAAHHALHMARRNPVAGFSTTTTTITAAPADQCPFDSGANTNMAVYWGQGANQQRLSHFCDDAKIDIIPIAFLNQFPDQTGGYPGSNFGNQCGDEVYKNVDGSDSQLKSNCPNIGPDIIYCQSLGKKILLSLGGAAPDNQVLKSDDSAKTFGDFLWRAFGPNKEAPDSTFPRPFGDASVDGFDLDIENVLQPGEDAGDLDRGYGTLVDVLRSHYALEPREYYISGAPQCVVPDAHLANAIQSSHFDFLFVQFYNTPECSARAYFDHTYGSTGAPTDISFDQWVDFVNQAGSQAKIFLGLPAAPSVVNDPVMYLQPDEAETIIDHFQCKYPERFGGVMVYEATASEKNAIDGKPYVDVLKKDLEKSDCANNPSCVLTPPVTLSTSTTPTSALASTSAPIGTLTSASAPLSSSASSVLPPYSINGTSKYPSSVPTGGSSGFLPSTGIPISPSGTSRTYAVSTGGTTKPAIPTGSGISYGTQPSAIPTGTGSVSPLGTSVRSAISGTAGPSSRRSSGASGMSSFASGGSTSPAIPSSSNVPYSVTNSSSSAIGQTNASSRQSTTLLQGSSASSTTVPGSATSASSMGASGLSQTSSGASGAPITSASSTMSAVSTVVTSAYVTTSPVTRTIITGGSQVVQTTQVVSTIYRTVTSTICTKCVATSTTAAPTAPASIQSITTTVVTYITTTICPVTQTATSNGVPVVMTTSTTSTITTSSTSTITLPPLTTSALTASVSGSGTIGSASGVSASSNGNSGGASSGSPASQIGNASPGQGSNVSQGQGSNVSQGQGSSNAQGQGSNASQGQGSNASQGQGSNASQGQANSNAQGQASNASQNQGSNASQGQGSNGSQGQGSNASQGQASNAPQAQGSNNAQVQGQQGPAGNAPASSTVSTASKSPKTMKIIETIIPKPMYSYQTANSAPSAAPFPQGNNGTAAGSSATGTVSSGFPSSTSPIAFTGAASRLIGGFLGIFIGLLTIALVL